MFLNGPTTASTTGRSRDERTETRSSSSAAQANIIQSLLNESLFQPADEFVRGNGKRFRATMARLGFHLAGGHGLPPRHVSEAIELLHAGSLIIDDVEDQTHSRRGKPAVHEQIGIPLAINTGNWLYFAALDQ